MKTSMLLLTFIFITSSLWSQSYSSTFTFGDQLAELKSNSRDTNFVNNYLISAAKLDDGFVQVVIETDSSKSETFKLKPFNYESFKLKTINALSKLIEKSENILVSQESLLRLNDEIYISSIFGRVVASFNISDEKPIAAKLEAKKNIEVIFDSKRCKVDPLEAKFTLNNPVVELSFFGGYIEKVEVTGDINGEKVIFTNKFSIGISSIANLKSLESTKLFSIGNYSLNANRKIVKSYESGCSLFMYLGSAIDYDREVDVNANDISPENQKIVLGDGLESAYLYKEESRRLLEAIVYSDFFGVFGNENPNGIIQTELRKRFLLNTNRKDISRGGKLFGFLNPLIFLSAGYGGLEYFDLDFRISKLESTNRFLPLEPISFEDSTLQVSLVDLYQYQNFLFGGNFNFLNLENQDIKFTSYLDAGFSFGRSGVSIDGVESNINSLQIPVKFSLNFIPEKRFSFSIVNELRYFRLLTNENIAIQSINDGIFQESSEWINTTSLIGNINISTNGRLFARYNFVHEVGNLNDNFSMFQFGYSFYILADN